MFSTGNPFFLSLIANSSIYFPIQVSSASCQHPVEPPPERRIDGIKNPTKIHQIYRICGIRRVLQAFAEYGFSSEQIEYQSRDVTKIYFVGS